MYFWLSVFYLIFLTVKNGRVQGIKNIALNKPARQAATLGASGESYDAGNAVDNYLTTSSSSGFDSRKENCWWQVDLQDVYTISTIQIVSSFNSKDNSSLNNIFISIRFDDSTKYDKNSLWSKHVIRNFPEGNETTRRNIPPGGILTMKRNANSRYASNGRYVTVWKYRPIKKEIYSPLSLAEVRIEGQLANLSSFVNIASNKPARQKYTSGYLVAGNAVDNNFATFSTSRDVDEGNCWWQVDLLNVYTISTIEIVNTMHEQFAYMHLNYLFATILYDNSTIYNEKFWSKNTDEFLAGDKITMKKDPLSDSDSTGRYVTIWKYKISIFHFLSLAEVQVEGELVLEGEPLKDQTKLPQQNKLSTELSIGLTLGAIIIALIIAIIVIKCSKRKILSNQYNSNSAEDSQTSEELEIRDTYHNISDEIALQNN